MASSAAKDPMEKEVTYSVCLEYFKDPVTIECGHNFCRSCLTRFWEESGNKETFCPLCRERVQQRNLRSNWQLANIIEITKTLPQGPRRAKDTERVCGKHQEPLKLFCKDDETPICCVCDRSKEHKDHTVIPVEEAAHDYKDLMGNHQDILEREKEKILVYKAEIEKETQDLLKQTEAEMENIFGEVTEIRQFLEEKEKHLWTQMEELKKQIVRKRDENLAKFDQELSSFKNLIQELKEKCQQPPAELLQDVKSLLQRSQEKKTFEKPVSFSTELKLKIWELYDLKASLGPVVKQFRDTLLPVLELQKANVTLDPDTVGPWLVLTEDWKTVGFGDKPQDLPDNPERFSNRFCVLGREGFTKGRHFWEVVVGQRETGLWG
nr:PREDICTED: tripartite motif-containing protein 7 [Anolis carolinensis]|eukprot:XP_008103858.2 PREDICTED: tripartite motif-containing protein 7 [Anolis carolinensis]